MPRLIKKGRARDKEKERKNERKKEEDATQLRELEISQSLASNSRGGLSDSCRLIICRDRESARARD